MGLWFNKEVIIIMASLVLNNKSLEVLEVEQNNLLKKNQDCYTGKIIVNPKYSSLSNSYNEGVRINQASNGWANVLFGASHNSTTGCEEGWLVGRRGEVSGLASIGDFSITYATSQANGLILKKDGTNPIWYGNRIALESNYATARPTAGSNNSLTSFDISLSITTKGRPVFIACTGNGNPANGSDWYRITLYRNGTTIFRTIGQSGGSSYNLPFAINYLDIVGSGTYTYKAEFRNGSGTMYFNEEGNEMIPQLIAFEI